MTVHVNIGEAKTRLSELVAAAVRGEDIVLDKAGAPQVRLVAVDPQERADAEKILAKRRSALGMYRHLVGDADIVIRNLKSTDEEIEDDQRRKFGPAG